MNDMTNPSPEANPTPNPMTPVMANDPAARTETGEIIDRSATPPADDPAPKPVEAKPEPVAYTDFSVPEGHTLDAATLESATPIFRELGLSQEQAQKLVDFYSTKIGEINTENLGYMEQMRTQWRADLQADKELGGKLDAVKVDIGRALDRLTPDTREAFKEAMNFTGSGDHPAVIKAMYEFSKLIGEGTHVTGANPSEHGQSKTGVTARPSAAQAMYPNLPSR